MRGSSLLILWLTIILSSCSSISNKSVSEELSTGELSKAIKTDTSFASFYESLRKKVEKMDDIKKAKFNDVTYRRLFKYFKFIQDSAYWKPLSKKWVIEWEQKFEGFQIKADSMLVFWKKYLEENSLNNYVKIELAYIDKEYYEYIGGIKDVNLGFRLIPLKGTIDQIRFNYGYKAKINGASKYYQKHNCLSTSPFSAPTIRYWEVGYSDKDVFAGKNVETFLRDYNVNIEITNIRQNGINISNEDFPVPKEISECLEYETEYPALFELSKEDLIKKLIQKDYMGKWEYKNKKADEVREKQDKLCFDFVNL
ncbi:MAG: hypothetical protein ACTHMC_25450 [Pseudobacter sp.]|uniref:hypothetical protein n=1 Tax=Pseudobacter sp. TaxID=2045420 RepID=UPI003F80EB08